MHSGLSLRGRTRLVVPSPFLWVSFPAEGFEIDRGSSGRRQEPCRFVKGQILYEKGIELKLSGNKIYYIACSLLLLLKNSCGKLHCQKVLI